MTICALDIFSNQTPRYSRALECDMMDSFPETFETSSERRDESESTSLELDLIK